MNHLAKGDDGVTQDQQRQEGLCITPITTKVKRKVRRVLDWEEASTKLRSRSTKAKRHKKSKSKDLPSVAGTAHVVEAGSKSISGDIISYSNIQWRN